MSVVLGKDMKSALTNADGAYMMENVTSGTYELKVVNYSYQLLGQPVLQPVIANMKFAIMKYKRN